MHNLRAALPLRRKQAVVVCSIQPAPRKQNVTKVIIDLGVDPINISPVNERFCNWSSRPQQNKGKTWKYLGIIRLLTKKNYKSHLRPVTDKQNF